MDPVKTSLIQIFVIVIVFAIRVISIQWALQQLIPLIPKLVDGTLTLGFTDIVSVLIVIGILRP